MRVDQFLTTLSVDGKPMGVWDTMAGGGRTASTNRYRPGGMSKAISLGGRAATENVTVGRLVRRETGDWEDLVRLHGSRVGKAYGVVSQRPMDLDGNPYGTPLVFRGIVGEVHPPDSNSNEDGEALWTIVIEPEG